jgi:hypothetical protein
VIKIPLDVKGLLSLYAGRGLISRHKEQKEGTMKCPKCGYVSFDDNESCPKCDKDIRAERAKLNLSDYRSDPPFLLGALTGQVNDSEGDMGMDFSFDMQVPEPQGDMNLVNAIETARDDVLMDKAEKVTVVIDKKKAREWAEA